LSGNPALSTVSIERYAYNATQDRAFCNPSLSLFDRIAQVDGQTD